jgi:hypothetical protein
VEADVDGRGGRELGPLLRALAHRGIPITRTDRMTLHNMCGAPLHQGIVLAVPPLVVPDATDGAIVDARAASEDSMRGFVVALDEIHDPHNLGAIMRSALLFGAAHVLLSAKNTAPLNATASKTSSGAIEVMAALGRLSVTRNMHATLAHMRDHGWTVTGTAAPPTGGMSSTPGPHSPAVRSMHEASGPGCRMRRTPVHPSVRLHCSAATQRRCARRGARGFMQRVGSGSDPDAALSIGGTACDVDEPRREPRRQ